MFKMEDDEFEKLHPETSTKIKYGENILDNPDVQSELKSAYERLYPNATQSYYNMT